MQSVLGVSCFLFMDEPNDVVHLDYDHVFAWIQNQLEAYVFVNMVNMSILVSYEGILVRSFFSKAQIAAIFSKSGKKRRRCGQLCTYPT